MKPTTKKYKKTFGSPLFSIQMSTNYAREHPPSCAYTISVRTSLNNYIPGTPQHINAALPHLWITCELQNGSAMRRMSFYESQVIVDHNTLVHLGSQTVQTPNIQQSFTIVHGQSIMKMVGGLPPYSRSEISHEMTTRWPSTDSSA